MTINNSHINCPHCDHHVDVNALLHLQLDAQLNRKHRLQPAVKQQKIKSDKSQIDATIEARITAECATKAKEKRCKEERCKEERCNAEDANKILLEKLQQPLAANTEQRNRQNESKMAMLFEFLQSTEFRLQVEAIVDGFTQMKIDLDKEKRTMQLHWEKREKQIEKGLLNTDKMYQSVRGIAGSSIQPVQALEFDTADV